MSKIYNPDKPLTDKEMRDAKWMRGINELPKKAQEAVLKSIDERSKPTIMLSLSAELIEHLKNVPLYNTRINDLLTKAWKEGQL